MWNPNEQGEQRGCRTYTHFGDLLGYSEDTRTALKIHNKLSLLFRIVDPGPIPSADHSWPCYILLDVDEVRSSRKKIKQDDTQPKKPMT